MRTFTEQQVSLYINSPFIQDKYKNKTSQELYKLQFEDDKLRKEMAFTSMLNRVQNIQTRLKRNSTKLLPQDIKETLQENLQLKKIKEQRALPVITEEPPQSNTKNYNGLFKQKINKAEWSKAELLIRDQYLSELEKLNQSESGCSQCAKNSLIRKYLKKVEVLNDNILK